MQRRASVVVVGGAILIVCVCITYIYVMPNSLKGIQRLLPTKQRIARLMDTGIHHVHSLESGVPSKQSIVRLVNSEIQHVHSLESGAPFRGLIESGGLDQMCSDVNKTITSETNPKYYPYEGIGTPAVVSDDEFGTEHFRGFCKRSLSSIIIAYSAAQNFDRRRAIRDSIGTQCKIYNCKLLFIVGISQDKEIADKVKSEYWEKLDMFMKNKIDTYVDLNNKAVAMLDWLLQFCQTPKYVIHLIDDAFVNVRVYLEGLNAVKDTDRYFYGRIFANQFPHRNVKSIYYVSPKVYPSPRYPNFVVGISYAFPNSLTRELRCAVHKAKYIWLEDVWLLGLIKEYLGLWLIDSPYESWHVGFQKLDIGNVHKYLYLHNTGVDDFYRFYKALNITVT